MLLLPHRYQNCLTHSLQLMGIIHKGKAACTKLKRWFVASCLLWSSCCGDAECTNAGRWSPTTPDSRLSQCSPRGWGSKSVRLSTVLIPGEPTDSPSISTCWSCTPGEVFSSTRAEKMERCQRQGEPPLCPLWSLTGWRGPLLSDQTQSPASS